VGWVMENNTQGRVGVLFCLFSFVVFLSKLIFSILNGYIHSFLILDNFVYLFYVLLFGMTIFWKSIVSKAVQIGIIIIEAILALSPDMSSSFFGLSMIITSLLLCVAYGVFNKHKTIKMIIVPILLYFILVFVPLSGNEKKFLMAFQWTMFICSFLFLIWMIFKDHIIKVNEYNSSLIRKYEDRTAILQVQLEKSIKAGIDLLDIIRSSDDKGDKCGE
jgi:hypothetical protein